MTSQLRSTNGMHPHRQGDDPLGTPDNKHSSKTGKYPIYIKQIFQILFVEKRIPMRLLVTRAEIKRMVKQSSLWAKLPRNKQNSTRIPGMPLAEHLKPLVKGVLN